MTERQAADAFVDAALKAALQTAGITWEVYPDMAPDGTVPPYVVYGTSTGLDARVNGRVTKWVDIPYTVRATALGNVSSVDVVETAIDAALNEVFQFDMNGYRFDSIRNGPLSTVTPRTAQTFRYAGGRYTVTVRKLITI